MTKPKSKPQSSLPFSGEVGKTLRARRLELGIGIDELAQETKIQKHYIKAIEASDFTTLPHSVQTVGFIKRYARLLGLDESVAANKYLLQRGPLTAAKPAKSTKPRFKPPIIGTRLLRGFIFGTVVVTVVSYLIWQLAILASPPRLSIKTPADNQTVSTQNLEIAGKTSPGVEVKVDGQVIYVDENGNFSAKVILSPGINIIKIDASNRKAQTTSLEKSVYYQVP